jgi:hypothetical protein
MSKVLVTVAIYLDGPSRRPQFIISANNLYSIQIEGTDRKGAKIGNSNMNKDFRHRFEYSTSGGQAVTRSHLVLGVAWHRLCKYVSIINDLESKTILNWKSFIKKTVMMRVVRELHLLCCISHSVLQTSGQIILKKKSTS